MYNTDMSIYITASFLDMDIFGYVAAKGDMMLDLVISYSKCRLSRCAVLGTVLTLLSFLWPKLILVIVMAVAFAFYLMHSLHTNKFMLSAYLCVLRCIVCSF